jgi:hypothetical protein
MYKRLLIIFLLSGHIIANAQVKVSPHSKMMFQKSSFGFISQLPPAPPRTLGSSYYADDWYTTDLFLKGETKLEGVKVKLDLISHNLEILHEGAVKVLPGNLVLSFQWITSTGNQEAFVRANYVTTEGLKLVGFLRLITDTEPFKLVEYHSTETLSANYNAALDVGSKDHQILRKTRSIIVKENLLLELKGGKKKCVSDFKEIFQTDVSEIIKEFNIDIRDEEGVILLLKQLNYSNPG